MKNLFFFVKKVVANPCSLVTRLAHDLGPDFEPYFAETLTTLMTLTSEPQIHVTEWTFNCLAYLFKYLARLLTTDLVPTYDLISPLLGKTHQKHFVSRFTAESLSFLVRKCTGDSLTKIITHIIQEVYTVHNEAFFSSCTLLLSESMKSTGTTLHSRAANILTTIFAATRQVPIEHASYIAELVTNVYISLLQHSQADSAGVLFDKAYGFIDTVLANDPNSLQLILPSNLIFALGGLRKGARVTAWDPLYTHLLQTLEKVSDKEEEMEVDGSESNMEKLSYSLLNASCALFQSSDLKSVTSYHNKLLNTFSTLLKGKLFLPFAQLLLEQASERFKSFAIPYVLRFANDKENTEYKAEIAYFIIQLENKGLMNNSLEPVPGKLRFNLTSSYILNCIENIKFFSKKKSAASSAELQEIWWDIEVLRASVSIEKKTLFIELLKTFDALTQDPTPSSLKASIVGKILGIFSNMQDIQEPLETEVFPKAVLVLKTLYTSPEVLKGITDVLATLIRVKSSVVTKEDAESIIEILLHNFSASTKDLRKLSLDITSQLYIVRGQTTPKLITQCQQIEDLPLDLNNARTLQMHIRNIGINFTVTGTEFAVDRVVPRFMFGLLTVHFQPVWESAMDGLAKISERDAKTIWEVAYSWISPENTDRPPQLANEIESEIGPEPVPHREPNCTNLKYVTEVSHDSLFQYYNSSFTMSQYVVSKTTSEPAPSFLRAHAIKVLTKVPTIAEKYARNLVEYVLWDENEDDEEEDDEAPAGASWTFKERTCLLELFSHFTSPKTVYRGGELYDRYLYLLGHRLLHIQQVAMKCIFTYKDPVLRKYKDSLNGLLDDPRFKDEMLLLLRKSGEDEETIHEQDRSTLLPIVIRILFGRAQISKAGNSKQGRRFAVLNALMNVEDEYVRLFITLATDKLHAKGFFLEFSEDSNEAIPLNAKLETMVPKENFLRRELGVVSMVEDILGLLRGRVQHSLDIIMESLLFALRNSQNVTAEHSPIAMKTVRSIRTGGMKCLELLFRVMENVTVWSPYFATIYQHLIKPRLATFAVDNLEQPSGIMKFFETLSSKPYLVQYLAHDDSAIIKGYFSCIADERVKDPVVTSVIDTMTNIMSWSQDEKLVNKDAWNQIVETGVPLVLAQLPHLFNRSSTIQLLDKESTLLVTLASGGYVVNDDVRKQLVAVCVAAIDRPSQQISLKIKGDVLRCLTSLLASDLAQPEEIEASYKSLAQLFKQFSDRYARQSLCDLYAVFGQKLEKYARVGPLIHSLNAFSTKRLGLPDFDKRLDTFSTVNEELYKELNAEEWRPLLFNLLFFLRDPEELSIRSNAEYALRRFIDCIAGQPSQESADGLVSLLNDIVLPALRIGLRDQSEVFRTQYITILGHIVKFLKWDESFDDMKCLLFHGDEEANFFNNILHIQIHRRQRAVKRLGILSEQMQLKDTSIAHYLMPIIEHFVEDVDGTRSGLANDTVIAIGSLTRHLTFNQYRAIAKRYISSLNKVDTLKVTVKLVDAIAESLGDPSAVAKIKPVDGDDTEMGEDEKSTPKSREPFPGAVRLAENLPTRSKLNNFIVNDIVPTLRKILDKRDETTFTLRIPLAIPVVKFLKVLPHDLLITKIPGVLTGLCQVLRAKSQELRDSLRKTLCTITTILGPKYLYFIFKELKGALRRGAQLHILGFTVHALLVHIGPELRPGDLDDSLDILSNIIMEDTFGATGAEKDNEGYTTTTKEIKQHKSYDTGEIVAANIELGKFGALINPIKTLLLYEKLNLKTERKVEELLRRLAVGLHANKDAASRDVLVMCYELYKLSQDIQAEEEAARKLAEEREEGDEDITEENESHFIVSLDAKSHSYSGKKRVPKLHTQNLHILVKFVFETVRQVLNKHMELLTVENVSGFVPFLGAGISAPFEDVQMSSLRLLTLILRLPIEDVNEKLMEYLRQAFEVIQSSPSTNTELCNAALRFVSVVIRSKEDVELPETAIGYILERLKPDLEEPDRQGIAFTFIKAILARGVVISEVYDVMDKISNVMVTNQTKSSREACRGVYYQFLTEYPQGKERLKKQFKFLVGNLQYPTIDGRLSVMELIHQLLTRIDDVHLEDITTSFFVALVLVLISDPSQQCKESASLLIRKLLSRAGDVQLDFITSYTLGWLKKSASQPAEAQLLRGGLQVAGLYFAELGTAKNKDLLREAESRISEILALALPDSEVEVDWSVVYFAMQLFSKLVESAPGRAFSAGSGYKERWALVESNLLYPHAWVRLTASRLLGSLFAHAKASKEPVEVDVKNEDLQQVAFKLVRQLSAANVTEELAFQDVKNLVFIGMQFESGNVIYTKPAKKGDAAAVANVLEEGAADDDVDGEPDEEKALNWLVRKVSSILRGEKRAREMKHSKKAAIQFLASVIQFVDSVPRLQELQDEIIFAFYNFLEPTQAPSTSSDENEAATEFRALTQESMDMLQNRVGTTEYLQAFSRVRQTVADRRAERKRKRAVQAVADPQLYAQKKLRKNEKKREKRKHVKDENGYYHTKKKRT